MQTKYHTSSGGRVALSGSERRIETTSCYKTKNNLKSGGLDTGSALLDHRSAS
jgi:hypothetical protein